MLLPIYVSLEKIDSSLDGRGVRPLPAVRRTFRRVILPLSLPGVFAGTLLTFIPATGDFINARFLGNPNTTVIGQVVQSQFLSRNDYPTAAAISFVLMAIITVAVLVYAKFLGTDDLCDEDQRCRPPAVGDYVALCRDGPRVPLPVHPVVHHRRVQLQQAREQLQHHLERVHAGQLEEPVRRHGLRRRLRPCLRVAVVACTIATMLGGRASPWPWPATASSAARGSTCC